MEQIVAKRAKVVAEKNNSDDRISSLPDHILHQVISLLPPRYATATSVLSHRWETIWLSFPVIDLDESDFSNREKLCSCLKSTSSRHNLSNLQTLRLRINLYCNPQINRSVYEFINTVLPDGKILKELEIGLTNCLISSQQDICVPEIICIRPKETFSSCSNLVSLRVDGCRFIGCPRVDLPKLKALHLKNMFIHEEFLVDLIHACPIVETLSIKFCFRIQNLRICHRIIKNLVLGFRDDLETLELNLPGVKCIKFHALAKSVTREGLLKVLGYQNSKKVLAQNLETLCLERLVLEPDVLHNLISIFPKMVKLDVNFCDVLGRALLNSETLMSLEMNKCTLLDEVDIGASNLQNVNYVHNPKGIQFNHETLMYVRRLSLDSIDVEHEILWINSSNFPALVSLKLGFCSNMKQLRIASNKLESLDVHRCGDLVYCMIVAPQLLNFTYSGKVVHMAHLEASKKLRVTLKLEDANCGHEHVEFVNKFVGFLQKVGASAANMAIEMGYSCTECLTMIKAIQVPPTSLVQHLKFDSWPDAMGLRDLVSCLLGISIYCNNLSINLGWLSLTLKFQEIKWKEACVRKTNLARIEDHLVRVEMKNFIGSAEEVGLVEFLVGMARHMQHMIIWMKKGKEDDATRKCLEACRRKLHPFNIVSHGGCVSFSRNAL
ncbi:putative F-box/FBD/LRR-repeat protein at5g44950 [Phtheirospermum japonicum]|uniref:Putative F-box/FBD/LRR-repeat protein at5g44950 n=1 Tax=Phtheirospermum japonicum TaxID=374723 RepID=A0A830BVT2_9LAMI|nr:putative F-box/FBD/LRR-repeat protein at5g44950 [Phtheirospermum japonicum]